MKKQKHDYEAEIVRVGENIKKIRLEKKLTQAELALLSDLDKQSVFRIEKGQLNMTIQTLFKIADALEVTTDKLMFGK